MKGKGEHIGQERITRHTYTGVIKKNHQAVFFWICHLKLLGTKPTYVFGSDIWPYRQSLSQTAAGNFLECSTKVVQR